MKVTTPPESEQPRLDPSRVIATVPPGAVALGVCGAAQVTGDGFVEVMVMVWLALTPIDSWTWGRRRSGVTRLVEVNDTGADGGEGDDAGQERATTARPVEGDRNRSPGAVALGV